MSLVKRGGVYMKKGFTIVELLIVVVVIAILAAITIVAYNGIQNQTHDSVVQSELRQMGIKITEYHLRHNDTYPLANASQLGGLGVHPSRESYGSHYPSGSTFYNFLYCYNNSENKFALFAASRSGNTYYFQDGSVKSRAALKGSVQMCTTEAGINETGRVTYWLYGQAGLDDWATWI